MTPDQYRQQRGQILLALYTALEPLLRLLHSHPSDTEWRAFVEAAYPSVYRARMDVWRLARRFYGEERQRAVHRGNLVDFPRRNYSPADFDAALRERVKPAIDALDEGSPVPRVVVNEVADIAERHADAGGREGIVDAARHDSLALGYARITTGEKDCAFCLMLVSRGPVYKTASTALLRDGTSEPYHDNCDCIAVPVFNAADWPGRDQYQRWERAWREHGGDLNTWRRWIEHRDDEPAAAAA